MVDFGQVLKDVRAAYATGRTRELKFRKEQLKNLQKLYEENVEAICTALAKDLGKPRQESILLEINVLKDDILFILNNIDEWVKPEKVTRNIVTMFDRPMIYHEPYGVVLVMGAWNYPVQLPLLPVSGAIAAGNCVVIKPSELAPATSALLADLVPKYLDKECFRVVEGGIAETTALLKERFDYIFFTGSTTVGKIVRQAANEHLTPTTLELGGKSPLFIDDTVDFDIAVRRILWGKLINAGQTCIAPDYVLCTKEVQAKFVSTAKQVLQDFYGNDPQKSSDFCRIISEKHVDRLTEYLKSGTAVIGGQVDRSDKYIAPTVLIDVDVDSKVMTEEIFGPILPIVNVGSAEEAKEFINQRHKPLTSYIFSNNSRTVNSLLRSTSSGGGCVNDVIVQLGVQGLPFGGVGNSGMGCYHGHASYLTFTHRKSCLIRNYNSIADFIASKRYPPYKDSNANFLSLMLRERKMPSFRYLPHLVCFCLGVSTALIAAYYTKFGGSGDE